MNWFITILTKEGSVFYAEYKSCLILANVAFRKLVGEALKEQPLVFACKLIRCVYFNVAFGAQSRLVGATNHRRRRLLAHITLNLHLQRFNPVDLSDFFHLPTTLFPEKKKKIPEASEKVVKLPDNSRECDQNSKDQSFPRKSKQIIYGKSS